MTNYNEVKQIGKHTIYCVFSMPLSYGIEGPGFPENAPYINQEMRIKLIEKNPDINYLFEKSCNENIRFKDNLLQIACTGAGYTITNIDL